MCGLPGYGPGDLIDLAFEGDRVRVTFTAGMVRPLRLTTDEAVALVVALRTLLELPGLAEREAVSRALAKVSAAAGHAADRVTPVAVSVDAREEALAVVRDGPGAQAGPAPALLRAHPRRAHRAHRRPDAAAARRRHVVPGGLVPPGRGRAAVPARPGRRRRRPRRAGRPAAAGARARRRRRRLPARARTPRRSGCGWPAAPAGSPTTTRSTRCAASTTRPAASAVTRPHRRPRLGPPARRLPRRGGAWSTSRPTWPRRSPPTPAPRSPATASTQPAPAPPVRVGPVLLLIVWIVVVVLALVVLGGVGVRRARRLRPAGPRGRGAPSGRCARSSSRPRRPRARANAANGRLTATRRGHPRATWIRTPSGVASPVPPTPGGPMAHSARWRSA